ncbi:MAG: pilus assembly protein [Rhodospirillales bacterium]|nr:pilus assembly protein [Rhodospirillales bacterium]
MAKLKSWVRDDSGVAAMEFTLVFPLLMLLLIGVFDLGNGILANQKTIMASQTIADLVARNTVVNSDMLDEAVRAGELALYPFPITDLGIDIISVEFDENDDPQVVWRETRNMTGASDAMNRAVGLGTEGDGAVIVIVRYNFDPTFSLFSIDSIGMEEVSFSRGRRSAVVQLEN